MCAAPAKEVGEDMRRYLQHCQKIQPLLLEAVDSYCAAHGISRSEFVRDAIENALSRMDSVSTPVTSSDRAVDIALYVEPKHLDMLGQIGQRLGVSRSEALRRAAAWWLRENGYSLEGKPISRYLLNSAVITGPGTYSYQVITVQEAKAWLQKGNCVSAIGYEETADHIEKLCGIRPEVRRESIMMDVGDEALVVRLKKRLANPSLKGVFEAGPDDWEYGLLRKEGP